MTTDAMRLALVGGGVVARWHAEAIQRLRATARLVVLVGRRGGSGQALAESLGVDFARSLEDVVARSDIDAVVICTPSGSHADTAVTALEAGKHVLVEKPLDVTFRAGMRVVEVARRSGLTASVVSQHRFDPASRAVQDALRSGRLGRVTSCLVSTPWWRDPYPLTSSDLAISLGDATGGGKLNPARAAD